MSTEKKTRKARSVAAKLSKHSLTAKQKKLIEAVLDPRVGTVAEAGKIAGYKHRQHAHEALHSVTVRKNLMDLAVELDNQGVDIKYLAKKLKAGMESKLVKTASHNGSITDEREYPDMPTRKTYLELTLKALKLTDDDDNKVTEQHLHIHVADKKTGEILEEIRTQLSALGIGKPENESGVVGTVRPGPEV